MNIYKLKRNNSFYDVARFVLIYSCCVDYDEEQGFPMNQAAIHEFFDISKRTIVYYFGLMREHNFINIVDKVYLQSVKKSYGKWYSNLYIVDKEALNQYFIDTINEDILANMEENSKLYYAFLKGVYTKYAKRKLAATSDIPIDEAVSKDIDDKLSKRLQNKVTRDKKKLDTLRRKNAKYLRILSDINKDSSIQMSYLDQNRKRLTNPVCVTKNPEKHPTKYGNAMRMSMLHEFFGTEDNIVEFDTNASIYRLSYALGNERVASHDEDIYKLIYDACDFGIKWTKELRDNFKQLLMPIYMRERAITYKSLEFEKQSTWDHFFSKTVERSYLFYKSFVTLFGRSLKDILTIISEAMHRVFNLKKFYMADIFIHESNLHLVMCRKFKELGISTMNVYDGFYFVEGTMTQELYDKVYDEATLELLEDYKAYT